MASLSFALALLAATPAQGGPPPGALRFLNDQGTPAPKAELACKTAAMIACRRAFVGQDYLPQPAIWRVADADTTLYLFGASHRLPLNFGWRSPQLDGIIPEARLLITETGLPGAEGQSRSLGQWADQGRFAPPPPVAERVHGERRAKWLGMAAVLADERTAEIDRLPTWIAAAMIGQVADGKKTPPLEPSADAQLEELFRKAGKPVAAIEDGDAVLAHVSGIPEKRQRRMLEETLDAVGRPETVAERVAAYHDWARGEFRLGRVWADADRSPYGGEFRRRLLANRNAAWADRLRERMAEPGVVLVAVGAGHLDGAGSLLDHLARRGLAAERVSPTTPPRPRPAFLPKPASWADCGDYYFGNKVPEAGGD